MPDDGPVRSVVVALSGGVDSTVLLRLLAGQQSIRNLGLRALHVHHGLHADADAWAAQCRTNCDALQVPLQVVRVDVAREAGAGPEAAARDARYRAFAAALEPGDVLALGHHREDQAETFLLRALRASGPTGLGAMRYWRRFGETWLWRPLLAVPRATLLDHARQLQLKWIEDDSNADARFDRNFLRAQIMPLLRERWPQADASLARAAALSADSDALLDAQDAAALATTRTLDRHVLSVPALRALELPRRARVLRAWVAELGLPPVPAQGISMIESDLLGAASDGEPTFAWRDATVRRWRDLLHAGRRNTPLPGAWRADWDGLEPLLMPGGDTLRLEPAHAFDAAIVVSPRRGGERIVLPGRRHTHALKHVLQELGVPPWVRERLPLLRDADGVVLAAGDLAFSASFDAWMRARDAGLVWRIATPVALSPAGAWP